GKPLPAGTARPRLLRFRSAEQSRADLSPTDRARSGGQLGTHRPGPHVGTAEPPRGGGHLPTYARGHVRRQPGLTAARGGPGARPALDQALHPWATLAVHGTLT